MHLFAKHLLLASINVVVEDPTHKVFKTLHANQVCGSISAGVLVLVLTELEHPCVSMASVN